jgi:hypothetical protein
MRRRSRLCRYRRVALRCRTIPLLRQNGLGAAQLRSWALNLGKARSMSPPRREHLPHLRHSPLGEEESLLRLRAPTCLNLPTHVALSKFGCVILGFVPYYYTPSYYSSSESPCANGLREVIKGVLNKCSSTVTCHPMTCGAPKQRPTSRAHTSTWDPTWMWRRATHSSRLQTVV